MAANPEGCWSRRRKAKTQGPRLYPKARQIPSAASPAAPLGVVATDRPRKGGRLNWPAGATRHSQRRARNGLGGTDYLAPAVSGPWSRRGGGWCLRRVCARKVDRWADVPMFGPTRPFFFSFFKKNSFLFPFSFIFPGLRFLPNFKL
jgi:hypothetical protein